MTSTGWSSMMLCSLSSATWNTATGHLGCDLLLGPVPDVEQLRDRPLGGPSDRVREPLPIARVGDHDGRQLGSGRAGAQLGDRILHPELDAGKIAAVGTDEIQEALVDRRVGGIERDETDDVVGVLGSEQPGHGAAQRVGGEDVRAGNVGRVEQFLELGDHVGERAGQRHRIAPTRRPVRHLDRAGPVVGADPGELETAANTGVNVEPGASTLHWLAASPPPDSRMTVGLPSPRHSRYTERPDGSSTSPAKSSTLTAAAATPACPSPTPAAAAPPPERDAAQACDHDATDSTHAHRASMRRAPPRVQPSWRKEQKCTRL